MNILLSISLKYTLSPSLPFKLNRKFHMIDSYSQICEIDNCETCGIINMK